MIVFDDITLSFSGKSIFSGLSLSVNRREKVLLSGRSGLGKTSLFYMLLGFLIPDEGGIFFEDKKLDSSLVWALRKKVTFLPQDLNIGSGRTRDLMHEYLSFRANPCFDKCRNEVYELMDFFELDKSLLDKDIDELSGGEKQRIAIIIALMLKREVFLLDEPTSFLDAELKKKTADFFLNKSEYTLLVVSHDKVWHDNKSMRIFDVERGIWAQ